MKILIHPGHCNQLNSSRDSTGLFQSCDQISKTKTKQLCHQLYDFMIKDVR